MRRQSSIFHSAMMLTAVHLLLRTVGTSFQVYLSGRIGAEGIGLLQLTLSVGSFAMIAGMAGIRTAVMYLTAEELGKKRPEHIQSVLSGCFRYSLLTSCSASVILLLSAPIIAEVWITDSRIVASLRLLAAFLPVSCLCGVLTGYFTAAARIRALAAIEVCEQLFSMTVTVLSLTLWAGNDPGRACESVILGSGLGSCLTAITLTVLRLREPNTSVQSLPIAKRLTAIAAPLALADLIKSGISTTENLLVPKRLKRNAAVQDPMAAFGRLSGMVFPVLMFPACILHALADLLIPELARCAAAGNTVRIQHLVKKGLKAALLYGLLMGGLIHLFSDKLCNRLYSDPTAGLWLSRYALLIPMLYCDTIVDAMTKGLGQQTACVRYNIITSAMDVIFLFFLLPVWGMEGYYFSFLITHLLNFLLSIRRLLRISKVTLKPDRIILTLSASAISLIMAEAAVGMLYPVILACILQLMGILGQEDARWVSNLLRRKKATAD